MSKYRIIKSLAINQYEPYIVQKWESATANWVNVTYVYDHFKTLKAAKQWIEETEAEKELRKTPAEVVWESDDVSD